MATEFTPTVKLFQKRLFEDRMPDRYTEVTTEFARLEDRIEELEQAGKIAEYTAFAKGWDHRVNLAHRNNAGGHAKRVLEQFERCRSWAHRSEVSLEGFQEVEIRGERYAEFPDLCLVAEVDRTVTGVFPCLDGTKRYSIDDYLDALAAGRDWRSWQPSTTLSTPDRGDHGAIKTQLIDSSESLLGPDWEFVADEYSVPMDSGEGYGHIDLVFTHEADTSFLLVEVKPGVDEIDQAFGQLLRYQEGFLQDRSLPYLSTDDIELAIASPHFAGVHKTAASRHDIRTVEV